MAKIPFTKFSPVWFSESRKMPTQILHAGDSAVDVGQAISSTVGFGSVSLHEKRVGPTNDDSHLHAAGALPESDDVSFGVLEVGCEAHVSDCFFLPDCLAA